MNFETEFMEERWQKDFDKLEDDFDSFRNYYNQNKKCECDIDECKIALNFINLTGAESFVLNNVTLFHLQIIWRVLYFDIPSKGLF